MSFLKIAALLLVAVSNAEEILGAGATPACPDSRYTRNPNTGTCQIAPTCPPGSYLNLQAFSCEASPLCIGMQILSADLKECICPPGQPFTQAEPDGTCKCPGDLQRQGNQCVCPTGRGLIRQDDRCVCDAAAGQTLDSTGRCACSNPQHIQSGPTQPFTCRECDSCYAKTGVTQCSLNCQAKGLINKGSDKCGCQNPNDKQSDTSLCGFSCEPCPDVSTVDPNDPTQCKCPPDMYFAGNVCKCNPPLIMKNGRCQQQVLPKPPLHDNEDGVEVIPGGKAHIKRETKVQLLSVSPLDRLLNQINTDDEIDVEISCYPRLKDQHPGEGWPVTGTPLKSHALKFQWNQINTETCWNGALPPAKSQCPIDNREAVACNPNPSNLNDFMNYDFKIELRDRSRSANREFNVVNDLSSGNPSLGYFVLTREMIQCLGQDKVKIIFEFDKRQGLAGAESCFDHTPYIITSGANKGKEDSIPFTNMDICNKNSRNRKRCFLYAYQVTLHVTGPFDITPKPYVKVCMNSVSKMVILPGDQIFSQFKTDYTQQDSLRVMPEIYDPTMPVPIRQRYQFNDVTRLPCDDRKVADLIEFEGFCVYCTDPDQKLTAQVQGAGEIASVSMTCRQFMDQQEGFSWDEYERTLRDNSAEFKRRYTDLKPEDPLRSLTTTQWTDKMNVLHSQSGQTVSSNVNFNFNIGNGFDGQVDFTQQTTVVDDFTKFDFSLEYGYRLHSEEPRCYQGMYMSVEKPSAKLKCEGRECFLNGPVDPNKGKRMLNTINVPADPKLSGPDNTLYSYVAGYNEANPRSSALTIPTKELNCSNQCYLPAVKLDQLLQQRVSQVVNPTRRMLAADQVIEGQVSGGKANLSTSLENQSSNAYQFRVNDKLRQDAAPPAAIKIEKLPKHGKIMVTDHDGTTRELMVGDVISTQLMANFKYKQGTERCSVHDKSKCDDEFLYSTLSSWVGIGEESSAQIKLTPAVASLSQPVDTMTQQSVTVAPVIETKPEAQAKPQETTTVAEDAATPAPCSDMPAAAINALIGIASVFALINVGLGAYFVSAKRQKEQKRATEANNKDFDAIADSPAPAEVPQ